MNPELNAEKSGQGTAELQARANLLKESSLATAIFVQVSSEVLKNLPKVQITSDGSTELINKDKSRITLNSNNQVIQIIDTQGKSTVFSYGKNGLIDSFSDSHGTFNSEDGYHWYKDGNGPPKAPDRAVGISIGKDFSILEKSTGGRQCTLTHTDGSRTIHDKDGGSYREDHQRKLLEINDPYGKKTILNYDAGNKLSSQTVINRDGSQMTYNNANQITELVDVKRQKTSLKYAANGTPNEITDSRGTYSTKNGVDWTPSNKDSATKQPFLRGEFRVQEDGTLLECNYDSSTLAVTIKSLNGKQKLYQSPGTLDKFKDVSNHLFKGIDTDQNGYLSGAELGKAIGDKKYSGHEAQVIAALHKKRQEIADLSNDEYGKETSGVSKADLDEFDKLEQNKEKIAHAKKWLEKNDNFNKIDKDRNGFLSSGEIAESMNWRDKDNFATLHFLFDHYQWAEDQNDDEIGVENNGITKKDLAAFSDKIAMLAETKEYMKRTSEAQNPALTDKLYSSDKIKDSIKPEAIQQGTIGNCYFQAALLSVAASKPATILSMIHDNKDGSYTVLFPGDPTHPVTVQAPTEAEMGLFSRKNEYGIWPNVLEKAYGQYKLDLNKGRNNKGENVFTPAEGADGGGCTRHTIQLLTGKNTMAEYHTSSNEAQIQDHINKAIQEKRVVSCASIAPRGTNLKTTPLGFAKTHAFSITDFDPSGPDGGTITIRNPWGYNENSPKGTMKISFRQLMNNFNHFSYEER